MYEDLIPAIATATRIACLQPEVRGAAAAGDAEIFGLLAESAPDPGVAGVLRLGANIVGDLASAAGPLADGIISNSNRRLLAHLRAGDADAAEQEMEKLLRCLHMMWRLARMDKLAALTCEPPAGHDPPQPAGLGGRSRRDHGEPGLDLRAHRLPDRFEVKARLLLGRPAP